MSTAVRRSLFAFVVVLLICVGLLQAHLDPLRRKYQPGEVTNIELGGQFVAATLIGLKEVVAGILWVRADEFFHTGNYEAIMPIVRIVTWLDPHQMDVYDTGAWHLAYNFTDSQERSDRRFIPAARALLREGVRNNPNTFDLYFSSGWLNFNKVLDFEEAIKWLSQANTKQAVDVATGKKRMRPQFVGHTLAHSMVKNGQIEMALAQWNRNIESNLEYLRRFPNDGGNENMVTVAVNNRDRILKEIAERGKIKPMVNAGFDAFWQPIGPRKFRVWGKINLPNGARVRLRLADKAFREEDFKQFTWEVDDKQTILIDDLYVRDGGFQRVVDIERDAAIYPLLSDSYEMTFTFNPLTAPDFVQDLIGWKGVGLADNQPNLIKVNGVKMLQRKFEISRSQLL